MSMVLESIDVHFPVGPSTIIYLHDTQITHPIVSGGSNITLSDVSTVSVIVGFTACCYYEMVGKVLSVITLSLLPHPAPYIT